MGGGMLFWASHTEITKAVEQIIFAQPAQVFVGEWKVKLCGLTVLG